MPDEGLTIIVCCFWKTYREALVGEKIGLKVLFLPRKIFGDFDCSTKVFETFKSSSKTRLV